jgi:hypothetical protein
MEYDKIFKSKWFKAVVFGIAVIIVFLAGFRAGTFIGFRKANFSYKWGENYHQNFGGPRAGFFGNFGGEGFMDAHGVFGQIMKIDGLTLVIKGADNVEKIVLVKDDTIIRNQKETLTSSDLKTNDFITVIGGPNDSGQIEAKFIRILPASPELKRGEPMPAAGTERTFPPPRR